MLWEKLTSISPFLKMFSKGFYIYLKLLSLFTTGYNHSVTVAGCQTMKYILYLLYPFPKVQILDTSKLKEFADDNFEFNENGRKLSR